MHTVRLLAVSAAAALLAACSGGGGHVVPPNTTAQPSSPAASSSSAKRGFTTISTFVAKSNSSGRLVRILPTRDVLAKLHSSHGRTTKAAGDLLYWGGAVQTNPHLYVVFWGSGWYGPGDPYNIKPLMENFYSVIGGSRWLNSVTQYTQSDGTPVGNFGNIFYGSYVDPTDPPTYPADSDIANEAAAAAAYFGDYSPSASYVVATPSGVQTSGFGTQYCAWHSSTYAAGGQIAFTNEPYMPDAGASCGAGSVNPGSATDGVTIVAGHEQGETETDPFPSSGWVDAGGAENGDKCAWTGLINNPDAGGYPTQPLWSNNGSYCPQAY
jgi:hypothetical protein